jgi:two-component system LytT family response regulator
MKVLIIEDEKPAAEKLQKSLQKTEFNPEVIAVLKDVESSVEWFNNHSCPDLVFMDIELTDGNSFTIFEKTIVSCPVIFTTAYDDYWQKAFEHNSIDYLLKPVRQEKLDAALSKYDTLKKHFNENFRQMIDFHREPSSGEFRKRFLVKRGADYISIKTEDVAYFYATHKLICLVEHSGQKFILDQSLSDIEKQLNPALFYRVNRKFLVNMNAIKKIRAYGKSKLILEIEPPVNEEVLISQENVMPFKEWMGS